MAAPLETTFLDSSIPDSICLRNLHLSAIIGNDAWNRQKAQPVVLSVKLSTTITSAGATDDIRKTTSYGQICKDIMQAVEEKAEGHENIVEFNLYLFDLAREKLWGGQALQISILLPKASLRAEGGICLTTHYTYPSNDGTIGRGSRRFDISCLKIPCIIGVNAHERREKQLVVVDISLSEYTPKLHNLTKTIVKVCMTDN